MRWRYFSCALVLFFASIGLSRADVTYSYVAGPQTGAELTSSNPSSPYYPYYLAGARNLPSYDGGSNYGFITPYNAGITFNFYVQRKF